MKKWEFSAYIGQFCMVIMLFAVTLPVFAIPASSNPGKAKIFGKGMPVQLEDLPPGRAKARLNELPSAARRQALKWLQRFSFPEADLEFLQFDDEGGVFYADTHAIELTVDAEDDSTPVVSGIQPADTFRLHSRPGATKIVFLDFDGHTISGTAWNYGGPSQYFARPYDIDGLPSTFSDLELNRIQEIWHRVAEDFAPFDIDVTTEDPGVFGPTTGRVLITHNVDANNNYMPHSAAGGVAYVGVYGDSYYEAYSPALVYYNNLGNGYPTYVAEAISHEFGHNLGLTHDGRDAPYYEGYYQGHGTGYISWGPIMGVGYYANVTQWSQGGYAASNNFEDDLSIIGIKLGFRPDDHGNMISSATPLYIETDGSILVTTPETENYQLPSSNNKGVIESETDIDVFSFNADAGLLNIIIQPAWTAFYRDNLRGANLDVSATLYNQAGEIVASSDPIDNTDASISTTVVAGNYYLAISGAGNAPSPYSAYGSLGQYFISGAIPTIVETTPVAPSALSGSAASYSQVNLTWADNANNETGIFIEHSTDQLNWVQIASLSQESISYSDTGLSGSTTYYYRVSATNNAGSATSNAISITTPVQIVIPVAPSSLSGSAISYSQVNLTWTDNANNETGIFIERSVDQQNWVQVASLSQGSISYSDTGLSSSITYLYRVSAFNSAGSAISNTATITTTVQITASDTNLDDDNDGLPDSYENQKSFLNPLDASDAKSDQDGDGLTNLQEYLAGSDPSMEDTDNDGLSDKYEIDNSLDPTDGKCPTWVCGGNRGWRQAIMLLQQEAI